MPDASVERYERLRTDVFQLLASALRPFNQARQAFEARTVIRRRAGARVVAIKGRVRYHEEGAAARCWVRRASVTRTEGGECLRNKRSWD